jgi:DNA-binding NarL/FixJ family response regulator
LIVVTRRTVSDVDERARAREAAAGQRWAEARDRYAALDPAALDADDHDRHADAAWWTCRLDESVAARARAYAGHAAAGAERRAGGAAWMLFYEHSMAGRTAVAAGWLRRARRHLDGQPGCAERCLLLWTDADAARDAGDLDRAAAAARDMVALATRCGDADLAAAGRFTEGTVLIAGGRTGEGLALLDEALCAVLAGELSPMFTGWLYCLGLQTCMALAELRRVVEWTDAAMAWCDGLPAGNNPFLGLCRVHRVEVLSLRGAWHDAEAQAHRAAQESLAVYPSVAGEAFYLAGDLRRRRGELVEAQRLYARAHELGRDPQPGLALVHLARGKADAAAAALTLAVGASGGSPLARSRLLAAQVEVALAVGDRETARAAADALAEAAAGGGSEPIRAAAATAAGAVALADGDPRAALVALRAARTQWTELGLPYEAAQARMTLAAACRAAGDREGERLELRAARAAFERLGSAPDVRRATVLLGGANDRAPLTDREVEVLGLVAGGRTNRDIATALAISEHTVARHLNNIFAKLDVSSRSAATAYAYTNHLV